MADRAAGHGARALDVDLEARDLAARATRRARCDREGHLHAEDVEQRAAERIAVEAHVRGLDHDVAPKRSVRTRPGS